MDDMSDERLERETYELINLGLKVVPEGEGMDLTDMDYTLDDIVRLKVMLTRIRGVCDAAGRALGELWEEEYYNEATEINGQRWYMGASRKVQFIEGMEEAFGEWLAAQPPEKIVSIVPARTLRVSKMGNAARDTFLDTKEGNGKRSIQHTDAKLPPRKKAMP